MASQPGHQVLCRNFVAAGMPQTAKFAAFLSQPNRHIPAIVPQFSTTEGLQILDEVFEAVKKSTGKSLTPLYIGSPKGGSLSAADWFGLVGESLSNMSETTKARFDELMGPLHASIARIEEQIEKQGGSGGSLPG